MENGITHRTMSVGAIFRAYHQYSFVLCFIKCLPLFDFSPPDFCKGGRGVGMSTSLAFSKGGRGEACLRLFFNEFGACSLLYFIFLTWWRRGHASFS